MGGDVCLMLVQTLTGWGNFRWVGHIGRPGRGLCLGLGSDRDRVVLGRGLVGVLGIGWCYAFGEKT